ncbi:MAG: RNA polymerase sigma factor [Verrucomicrobiales bacterium]
MQACFEELKEESAELVKQRYFGKLSCKEIAEKQNRRVSWVTSTLSRARKALKECLEDQLRPGGCQ